jgi:hypothetical protein
VTRCPVCDTKIPQRSNRGPGRPRKFCGAACKEFERLRIRSLRRLEAAADRWRERGYPSREAHVRRVIEQRIADRRVAVSP